MGGETHLKMGPPSSYPKLAAGPVGKKIHNIYADRLRMFMSDGQYREQNLPPCV
jgi:alpha-mannosidase